jgi:RNA polymerase sigma factor (TIGR02999 family)
VTRQGIFLRAFVKGLLSWIRIDEGGQWRTTTMGRPIERDQAMAEQERENLTALINQARAGSTDAKSRLLEAVYGEFHRIADGLMRSERRGHTLQPSALVNEAVIRLLDGEAIERAPNRRYLLAAAAQAMRRVLVDHARKRNAREGRLERVPLDDVLAYFEEKHMDFIELDDALDRLAAIHERQALVVVLRFFAGISSAQVADVLDVALATVEGDWRFARAWLRSQLGEVVQ